MSLKGLLGSLIEKIHELAEKARDQPAEGAERDIRIVSGFTIRTDLGSDHGAAPAVKIEPFGNVRADPQTGRTVVEEARAPIVDVFDESDHVLVLVEFPGIATEDVVLSLDGDLLTIDAQRGDRKYYTQQVLPCELSPEKMSYACRNGVLEIHLGK